MKTPIISPVYMIKSLVYMQLSSTVCVKTFCCDMMSDSVLEGVIKIREMRTGQDEYDVSYIQAVRILKRRWYLGFVQWINDLRTKDVILSHCPYCGKIINKEWQEEVDFYND